MAPARHRRSTRASPRTRQRSKSTTNTTQRIATPEPHRVPGNRKRPRTRSHSSKQSKNTRKPTTRNVVSKEHKLDTPQYIFDKLNSPSLPHEVLNETIELMHRLERFQLPTVGRLFTLDLLGFQPRTLEAAANYLRKAELPRDPDASKSKSLLAKSA